MGEFDDLFKDYENKNTVSTTQNQEPMGNSAVKNEVNRQAKRNRTMFLLYIVVTLVVSITTTVILNNKYDGITGTIRNLDIVGEISVITTPSTDDDFPFEYRMTGSIKNLNNYLLPIVYVEYTFYDDNEKVLGTYYIEKTALGPQETFTFDETALFETDFVSSDYDYGFDESPFFYLFVSFLQVAMAGLLFIFIDRRAFLIDGKEFFKKFGKSLKEVLLGFSLVWMASVLSQMFMAYVLGVTASSENESAIAGMFIDDPLQLVMLFFLLCVFTPIVEEIVFRKIICGFFERKIGKIWAILLSGAIFGLMHVVAYGDFVQSIPYITMGAVFGYIYFRSEKNIYVTIGVHFLNNLISYLFYLLPLLGFTIL